MTGYETSGSANRSLRERVGGPSVVTLAPFLWTSIITVGIMPIASLSSTQGATSVVELIALSAVAWLGFGLVLYIAGVTVLRNRAVKPVPVTLIVLVGIIAGLTRSFILGDWFVVLGIGGDHNFSKVTNGALTGAVWILVSAAVMDSKRSYNVFREQLITEQTRLITLGDEWLSRVREERKKLAESVQHDLAEELESTRNRLHSLMAVNDANWRRSITELALLSSETTQTLAASIRRIPQRKSGVSAAFETITAIPLLDGRGPAIVTALVGVLPVTRLTSLSLGLYLVGYAVLIIWSLPALGRSLINRHPRYHRALFVATCVTTFVGIMLTAPIMYMAGLGKFEALTFGALGATLTLTSLISFSLISLTQVVRRQDLKSMQEQNAMLEILENANTQLENIARIDLTSYLASGIHNAVKASANAIEEAIRKNNDDAVSSGLAVLDALSSNILGRYTSEEDIDFRLELASLAKLWSDQAIITWSIDSLALDREVSRRALLIIEQCFSHLLPAEMASRIHIDLRGTVSKANLILEINIGSSWLNDSSLTRDVLDASTSTNWFISGDHTHSKLQATIG